MFAYCLNNPVSFSDNAGEFAFSAFLGTVVGGAIGGGVISSVSYVVNSAISGQEITVSGLVNAAVTGAVCGAIGAAIGTISLAVPAATKVAKGIASAAVGIGMGIKAGIEANGTTGQKWATGVSTAIITGVSTYAGARIDAYSDKSGFSINMFTNLSATLFVGTPAEIISAGAQQGINSLGRTSSKSYEKYYSNPILRSRPNFGLSQFV